MKRTLLLLAAAGGSLLLTGLIRRYALNRNLLAIPNARSAHKVPVPCGGGLAIIAVFLAGLLLLVHWGVVQKTVALALAGGGILVGVVGFFDDRSHVAIRWRLLAHFAGASWVLFWLGYVPPLLMFGHPVHFGWLGPLLAALYLVWLLNLYNFMDGIDGIAVVETLTVCLGAALCYWLAIEGGRGWLLPLLPAAAVAGFAYWNLPPARIFMGDSGSGFLGLVLGALSLRAAQATPDLFWVWGILLGVFVVDATVTLLRRMYFREKFYQSHCDHAYQHAARRYGSHGLVSLAVGAINLSWLLPLAVLVALGRVDGLLALLIAYAPLVWLALHFDAGVKKAGRTRPDARRAAAPAEPSDDGMRGPDPVFAPWPCFSVEEGEAVRQVLLSNRVNYWTGEECRRFEEEFAAWVGCGHAVAVANGTVALEAALRALDVGPGDEVVVTPRTFFASASCIVAVGAAPVFAEVDRDSQNITAETIRAALTPKTRAIICVHLAGWPCDMDPIMALAAEHGLLVVEDCAQAHGARYKGRSVGSIGHVSAWSFCQDKIMTTGGEGGMVTTNDPEIWKRVWAFKDHGKSWDAVYLQKSPGGNAFRWVHESFGTNGRMTEMQAVLGLIQLGRMDDWHARRKANAERLAAALAVCPGLRIPLPGPEAEHAWYKFYAFVRPEALRPDWNRDRIMAGINEAGVPCFFGTCPEVYLEKAFAGAPAAIPAEPLPVARELGETSLLFLIHPTLNDAEISRTCEVVLQVMAEASLPAMVSGEAT